MMFHEMKEKDVEKILNTSIENGLTASDVEKKESSLDGMSSRKVRNNLHSCFLLASLKIL